MSDSYKDLDETILQNSKAPKSVQIDGQLVEQHSIGDLIKADKHLASKKAIKSRTCGLKFTKMSHSEA